ncbi:MAG: EamA family transporter [Candidatus Dormibacteraeota bacterium]|uniref:EamA family transporter n=1 Tax=Candidatus Dormiibacter inghamiae TaxID=3127013 RepID=A0A934KIA3_9BACT|nr:EamA family transporter [Candidatus Dormibacteraeota bacterium]MBJ7605653.1 EamA family transporter [Candidatus Dormibacteraeota bacterium]
MRFQSLSFSLRKLPRRARVACALPVVWIAFGSAFVALKVGVATVPPFLFSGGRFLLVGALLLGWSAWRARGRLNVSRQDVLIAAATGGGLIFAGQGAASWASQYLTPGIVAVLSSTMPLWAALIGWVALGTRVARLGTVGLVAGFGGVAFLVWPTSRAGVQLVPAVVTTAGAVGWAAGALFASRSSFARRPTLMTALQMLVGGGLQVMLGLGSGEAGQVGLQQVVPAFPVFLYLVIVPALIGFPLFTWLLTHVPIHVANTVSYAAPVVALALGWLLLGQQVTLRTLAGVAVILVGVGLIVWSAKGTAARKEEVRQLDKRAA